MQVFNFKQQVETIKTNVAYLSKEYKSHSFLILVHLCLMEFPSLMN